MPQIYNPTYIFWARVISALISSFYIFLNFFRNTKRIPNEAIKNIVVCQYHRIGDVILIAPVLGSLKTKFPQSKITLLCCTGALDFAEELQLADDVIAVDAPWTNWNWSLFQWLKIRSFAKSFRKKNIDLAIDFKGDIRNSWFLWHMKSKMSFGYADTGGSYFYTHCQPIPKVMHQTERSINLISELGCNIEIQSSKESTSNASGHLVLHAGGTDPKRSWPSKKWVELADSLSRDYKVTIIKTPETDPIIQRIKDRNIPVELFESDLPAFQNWLKNQKMLVGIDSMPGHLAAYLGVPVVSIFGSQDPNWTRPLGKWVEVVKPEVSCVHDRNHWRLCSKCMDSIDVKKVIHGIEKLISRVRMGDK